jgi:hypothetical protein
MLASTIAAFLIAGLMYLCGRSTARFAARKGRSAGVWFAWGCLFFAFASIVLALLPPHGDSADASVRTSE